MFLEAFGILLKDLLLFKISNPQIAFYSTLIEPYFMLSGSFFVGIPWDDFFTIVLFVYFTFGIFK